MDVAFSAVREGVDPLFLLIHDHAVGAQDAPQLAGPVADARDIAQPTPRDREGIADAVLLLLSGRVGGR